MEPIVDLEAVGNRAAMSVHALMEESTAQNDGAGIYLMVDLDEEGTDALIMGCPTLAAEDENARWYISSTDGYWHRDHPTFTHGTEPYEVRDWLREQIEAYRGREKQ